MGIRLQDVGSSDASSSSNNTTPQDSAQDAFNHGGHNVVWTDAISRGTTRHALARDLPAATLRPAAPETVRDRTVTDPLAD